MRVELRVTSGSRAGQRELFDKSVITVGRHPMNDFKFHPENDPDVSSRHAEIRLLEQSAVILDLNSTNGTFVNGRKVTGEAALGNGDVIAFGAEGPRVEFRVVTQVKDHQPPATRLGKASPAMGQDSVLDPALVDTNPGRSKAPTAEPRGAPGEAGGARAAPPRRDTSMRIAEAVEKQTGKLRTMVLGLGALVVVGVGGAWWVARANSRQAQAQIDGLLKRNDSLSAAFEKTVGSMRGKVAGLDSALQMSKADRDRLRERIQGALSKGSDADVVALSAQLDAAEGRQRSLISAARVDFEAIVSKNQAAMVFIAVEQAGGETTSGSGFNVTPSGLVVTNRHVVQNERGQAAKEVSVIFEGKTGAWKHAHVVKVSDTDELAWIKVDEGGPYPVVAGVAKNPNLHVGAPSAIIGYPLGTSTAGMRGDINKLTPSSTLSISTVSKVLAETLQLDTYAAEGSSGSPVFDARGYVVGVLYGGQPESGGRIVYAVPGQKLVAQMPPEGASIIR